MARENIYSVETRDGIVVYGIPPGVEPTDPLVRRAADRAREGGEKRIAYPYIKETELAGGMVTGVKRVGLNLAEMFGLVEPERVQAFEEQEALKPPSMGRSVGQFSTELLGTAAPAGAVVGGVARGLKALPKVGEAVSAIPGWLSLGGRGAAEGAMEGAVLAGPGERASGAATGAALSGGLGAGFGVATQGFRTPDEAAQRLLDMGVDLTPGQMKPQGFANMVEQLLQEVPLASGVVGAGRRGAQEDFAAAMVNQARPPGAPLIPKGEFHQMTDRVYDQFEPAYEVAKGYPVYRGWDRSLTDQFKSITERAGILAEEPVRRMTNNFLQAKLSMVQRKADKNQGLVDSGDLLWVRHKIRNEARKHRLAGNKPEAVEMLDLADAAITRELTLQLPADVMPFLKRVDRQFAKYAIIEDAAAATKRAGPPTPYQWAAAAHKNATKRQRAHGAGLFIPETQAGMEVFETTAPRTGARNITAGLLGLGGGYGAVQNPLLGGLIATAGTLGAGTRTGRQMAAGLHPVQQGVLDLLNQAPAGPLSTLGSIARASPVVYGQQPEPEY